MSARKRVHLVACPGKVDPAWRCTVRATGWGWRREELEARGAAFVRKRPVLHRGEEFAVPYVDAARCCGLLLPSDLGRAKVVGVWIDAARSHRSKATRVSLHQVSDSLFLAPSIAPILAIADDATAVRSRKKVIQRTPYPPLS